MTTTFRLSKAKKSYIRNSNIEEFPELRAVKLAFDEYFASESLQATSPPESRAAARLLLVLNDAIMLLVTSATDQLINKIHNKTQRQPTAKDYLTVYGRVRREMLTLLQESLDADHKSLFEAVAREVDDGRMELM
jgi:hypothetical protein